MTLDEAWAKVQEADTGGAAPAPGEAPGSPNSVLRRRPKANSKRGRSLIRTFTAYATKSRAPSGLKTRSLARQAGCSAVLKRSSKMTS